MIGWLEVFCPAAKCKAEGWKHCNGVPAFKTLTAELASSERLQMIWHIQFHFGTLTTWCQDKIVSVLVLILLALLS
jgi:hypothetical protein